MLTRRLTIPRVTIVAAMVLVPLADASAIEPARKPAAEVPQPVQVAVLRGRVKTKTGVPLPGVRVRVAVPAADMRFLDDGKDRVVLEVKTDDQGNYRLDFPGIAERTKVSIDATAPGFARLVGTLMAGGDDREVEVEPGKQAEANLELETAHYFRGVVVDEQGKPIPSVQIGAYFHFAFNQGTGGVEMTATGPDGSFELFNYSSNPNAFWIMAGKGIVSFSHPDYVESKIEDIYAIERDRRKDLRIVLATGRKVTGTVLDVAGKPVAKVMVEAGLVEGKPHPLGDGTYRKATLTDADGRFALRGLKDGETRLVTHALAIKQKVVLPMDLAADKVDLEVRLRALPQPAVFQKITVLGMELADVTPEWKSAYDLDEDRGALILDPGPDHKRLEIGDLAEGNRFWLVGEKHVASVREFVTQLLAETAGQDAEIHNVRVVYEFKTTDFVGTNTQHIRLTRDDLKELRALAEKLAAEAR